MPDKKQIAVAVAVLAFAVRGFSQVGLDYFPAGAANPYDWRSAITNPSMGALQTGALEVGFKILNLGFSDGNSTLFKAGYALVNYPGRLPWELTGGLQTQTFNTPLFSESEFRLVFSRLVNSKLAIGAGVAMHGVSYNRERFDLVDPDDPVFSGGTSLWQPDINLGVTIMPVNALLIGIGMHHLNQASMSLTGADIRLERTLKVSVSYSFGAVSVHASTETKDVLPTRGSFVQYNDRSLGNLQVGLASEAIWLRSQFNVSRTMKVGYGISFPINEFAGSGYGSHEASFIFEFDRMHQTPGVRMSSPGDMESFIPEMPRVQLVPQYFALASIDTVDVIYKRVYREIAADVDTLALQQYSIANLSRFDSLLVETAMLPDSVRQISLTDSVLQQGSAAFRTRPRYLESLNRLTVELGRKDAKTFIFAPSSQRQRALEVSRMIRSADRNSVLQVSVNLVDDLHRTVAGSPASNLPRGIKRYEESIVARPSHMTFRVFPIDSAILEQPWTLVVENEAGDRIFSHAARADQLQAVEWNLRTGDNSLLEPGYYRYFVEWKDRNGMVKRSAAQTVYARKLRRNIHLRITGKYENLDRGAELIGVFLNQ